MKIYSILDPSIFFLSEEDWQRTENQTNHIEHLFNVLRTIREFNFTSVLWSSELDSELWTKLPWTNHYELSIPIKTSLTHFLMTCATYLEDQFDNFNLTTTPSISYPYAPDIFCHVTENILYNKLRKNENIFFWFGLPNSHFTTIEINDKNQDYLLDKTLFKCEKWSEIIDPFQILYPKDSACDQQLLKELIDIERRRKYGQNEATVTYEFSDGFLKEITENTGQEYKKKIVECLAYRATMDHQSAATNGRLRDEEITRGLFKGQRRIRVTPRPTSARIHYEIINHTTFKLIHFWGPGEHDEGLRNH